jgi:hypothetical protein
MTVQELIDELNKVEDKSKEVVDREDWIVNSIDDCQDSVKIYYEPN